MATGMLHQPAFYSAHDLMMQGNPIVGDLRPTYAHGHTDSQDTGGLDFTPLDEFLCRLKDWTDAARVPWHLSPRDLFEPVSLPGSLDEEDISKVVAYSAGLPEISMLAAMVSVDSPRDAFAALVALSSMVHRSHWRQTRQLMECLPKHHLQEFTERVHPQCRIPASKLLLRLWGHKLQGADLVRYLHDREMSLREEAALCVLRFSSRDKGKLSEIASAILDYGAHDIIHNLITASARQAPAEVVDGMALVVSSLGFKFQGRQHLVRDDVLSILVSQMAAANDAQVSFVLLNALQCLCEHEDGRRAVHQAGGTAEFIQMLSPSRELVKYNSKVFEYMPETVVEIALRGLHLLAHDAEARMRMVDVGAASVVESVLESPEFLKSRRARLAIHRYGVPLLNLLSH